MLTFEFNVLLHTTRQEENPRCPMDWRGSGVYDVTTPYHKPCVVSVTAPTELSARKAVVDHNYEESDSVELISMKATGPTEEEVPEVEVIQEGKWLKGEGTKINQKNFQKALKRAS